MSCRLFFDKFKWINGILPKLWPINVIYLTPISFLERLRCYKVVVVTPSSATLAPSLPKRRWSKCRLWSKQEGEFSSYLSGSNPYEPILFLFVFSLVEIFNLRREPTSFKLFSKDEAPWFPILTETSESSLSCILGKTAVSLMIPESPKGLLSSIILVILEVSKKSLIYLT